MRYYFPKSVLVKSKCEYYALTEVFRFQKDSNTILALLRINSTFLNENQNLIFGLLISYIPYASSCNAETVVWANRSSPPLTLAFHETRSPVADEVN